MVVQGTGGWMGMDLPQATLTCLPSLAPRGKRGWKSFHGILKGMILYLQKVRGQEWAGPAEGAGPGVGGACRRGGARSGW